MRTILLILLIDAAILFAAYELSWYVVLNEGCCSYYDKSGGPR